MDQITSFVRMYWKVLVPILVALVVIVLLRGCSKGEDVVVTDSAPVKEVAQGDYLPYTAPATASPLTGEACANYDKRTFGVMYSGSTDARKYYHNLDQADFVLEMPHRPMHGEPRILGVFGCNAPDKAGPMRSGRVDHISVAQSLGAIYAPWGKSSIAGALLTRENVEHIEVGDGIRANDGTRVGFIDRSIPMTSANPAFADVTGLISAAGDRGYSSASQTQGFEHQGELPRADRTSYNKVTVKFEGDSRVQYFYDPETNRYMRFYGEDPHIDFASKEQYGPKNLITIITKKEAWWTENDFKERGLEDPWAGVPADYQNRDNGQYPNMQLGDPWFDTKFEGEARFFFNGEEIEGSWKRADTPNASFEFYDEKGAPVRFVPGQIWLHVLGHKQRVSHTTEEEYLENKADEERDAAEAAAGGAL